MAVFLGACASESTLLVDLRTDFGSSEFASVRTRISNDGNDLLEAHAATGVDYSPGVRVAEFQELTAGEFQLQLDVVNAAGVPIASRLLSGTLNAGVNVRTLVISRSCINVICPSASDPRATECSEGRCVAAECSPETPEACPSGCGGDAECVSNIACATGRCVAGECSFMVNDGACPAGQTCDAVVGCTEAAGDAAIPDAARGDGGGDAAMLDGGADAPLDASDDVGQDANDLDAGPRCECSNPEDMCAADCISPMTCNAISMCPTGYNCSGSSCLCSDDDICGRLCEREQDCWALDDCDLNTNLCRRSLSCFRNPSCPDGESCAVVRGMRSCVPNESRAIGSACSEATQCASGRCVGATGVCAQPCLRDSECEAGLACVHNLSFSRGGAACQLNTECPGTTCAPDEACSGFNTCEKICETTGDCSSGESCRIRHVNDHGRCVVTDPQCSPNEVLDTAGVCFVYQACWEASPVCPAGYDCQRILGGTFRSHCGRTL